MGLGICLSMMIMVLGYSFSKGIILNVVNKLVDANVVGHIWVIRIEKVGTSTSNIIRDRDELIRKIKENLPIVKDVREALSATTFAVGNGNGGMVDLTGIGDSFESIASELTLVDGDMAQLEDDTIENPLILEYHSAEMLNIKPGDIIRVRMNTIYGQVQTARLTLVATVESKNLIIGNAIQGLIPIGNLKAILGYSPKEANSLNVVLKNLDETSRIDVYADQLHDMLQPEPVSIAGEFGAGERQASGVMVGLLSDKASASLCGRNIQVASGNMEDFQGHTKTALIGKSLAEALQLLPGMDLEFSYLPRFEKDAVELKFKVSAIIEDTVASFSDNFIFINEKDFYNTWSNHLPLKAQGSDSEFIFGAENPLLPAFTHEWKLEERSHTRDELEKMGKRIMNDSSPTPVLVMGGLREATVGLFQLESSINAACMVVMIVVFAIILVGVVNSVRMNIRERTRETGTVRALGMQKKMVTRILISEICILSIFSVLVGIFLSHVAMNLLSMMTFPIADNQISFFLKNGHLQFMPPVRPIVINAILLVIVTTFTAWFPSRKAAKMKVADALEHFE